MKILACKCLYEYFRSNYINRTNVTPINNQNMAILVTKHGDESVDSMLKRFKRKCKKERIIIEYTERQRYIKPSEKRKRARHMAKLRALTEDLTNI